MFAPLSFKQLRRRLRLPFTFFLNKNKKRGKNYNARARRSIEPARHRDTAQAQQQSEPERIQGDVPVEHEIVEIVKDNIPSPPLSLPTDLAKPALTPSPASTPTVERAFHIVYEAPVEEVVAPITGVEEIETAEVATEEGEVQPVSTEEVVAPIAPTKIVETEIEAPITVEAAEKEIETLQAPTEEVVAPVEEVPQPTAEAVEIITEVVAPISPIQEVQPNATQEVAPIAPIEVIETSKVIIPIEVPNKEAEVQPVVVVPDEGVEMKTEVETVEISTEVIDSQALTKEVKRIEISSEVELIAPVEAPAEGSAPTPTINLTTDEPTVREKVSKLIVHTDLGYSSGITLVQSPLSMEGRLTPRGSPSGSPRNVVFPRKGSMSPRRVGPPSPQQDAAIIAEMQASVRSRESKRAEREAAERERTLRELGLPVERGVVIDGGDGEEVRQEVRQWRKEREMSLQGVHESVRKETGMISAYRAISSGEEIMVELMRKSDKGP